MARIGIEYFTDFRMIDNLNTDEISEVLEEKIDRLEPEFFIKVFGYEFQQIMLADDTNPIYESILNGTEYRNSNGQLVKWEGINESIANYIYYWWHRERTPLSGGVAFVKGQVQNATVADPNYRIVPVWNKLKPALSILRDYLYINQANYPTLVFTNFEIMFTNGL